MRKFLIFSFFILFTTNANAQYEEDTKTIQSTIEALYEVISGDAGVERDWDRFRNLFTEDAVLIPTGTDREGVGRYRTFTPQGYIDVSEEILEGEGFWETELSSKIEQFGNIAHVFSTYDSKRTQDGEVFMRGINSIQLFNDGSRWWVMSVFWMAENESNPIPEKYLGN